MHMNGYAALAAVDSWDDGTICFLVDISATISGLIKSAYSRNEYLNIQKINEAICHL